MSTKDFEFLKNALPNSEDDFSKLLINYFYTILSYFFEDWFEFYCDYYIFLYGLYIDGST